MQFYLQTYNNLILDDYALKLYNAVHYLNWYNNNLEHSIYLSEYIEGYKKGMIPVGSLKFVFDILKKYYSIELKPINVPECLFAYAHRDIYNFNSALNFVLEDIKFIKSNDIYKGVRDIVDPGCKIKRGNYQISEVIDIKAEWRAFIFNNDIIDVRRYYGNYLDDYDKTTFKNMVNTFNNYYSDKLDTYTLDFGIHIKEDKKYTSIIEVQPFISCGLYGFNNQAQLPFMVYKGFLNVLNSFNKKTSKEM